MEIRKAKEQDMEQINKLLLQVTYSNMELKSIPTISSRRLSTTHYALYSWQQMSMMWFLAMPFAYFSSTLEIISLQILKLYILTIYAWMKV